MGELNISVITYDDVECIQAPCTINNFCATICVFFFFKQKTAYEILTCDWSSDVCSSDLATRFGQYKKRGAAAKRNGQYKKLGRCRNKNQAV